MKTEFCDSCGAAFSLEQLTSFDEQLLCPECLRNATVICTHCGDRFWREENAGDSTTPLCQRCYDDHYLSCAGCGRVIHENDACYQGDDDDSPYCHSCYTKYQHAEIHDYYFKPEPIFYGTGPRYFGVELEIDDGGEDSENASKLLTLANNKGEYIYCKHDGSLNDGFEIVTHPMSLDYLLKEVPWGRIVQKAASLGYTSHQARTCGLHIHVSRDAFGDTEAAQDACIARILYFFEKHWDELLAFSRRTHRQLDRWAARYGYKEQPRDILEHAKKGSHAGRYACINLTNTDTIEFRMFRGTLKLNTLIATLQLVDRICDVALCMSDDAIKALSWTTFVAGCETPELVQYLKERRLYINDAIQSEEEI